MLTIYTKNRSFTDFVHTNIAVPKVYNNVGLVECRLPKQVKQHHVIYNGIDYFFHTMSTKTIPKMVSIQERFRGIEYARYSDITIRYKNRGVKDSEHFKIRADCILYGVINGTTSDYVNSTAFVKYGLFKYSYIQEKIDSGDILIEEMNSKNCIIRDNKLVCPINANYDGSSTFYPINVPMFVQLVGNDFILKQDGYLF